MSLSALSFTDHSQNSTNAVHVAWQLKATTASASAVEQIMERPLEMEYDHESHNLLHEAVDQAVTECPGLMLMPYEQMKAAALILAKQVIALKNRTA